MLKRVTGLLTAALGLLTGEVLAQPFVENFDKGKAGELPPGWSLWQPAGDSGKVTWNGQTGRHAPGAAEFIGCQRTVIQHSSDALPGKWYRLSGYAKTDVPSLAAGEMTITPRIAKDGQNMRQLAGEASSKQIHLTEKWQRLEVVEEMPGEAALNGAKLSGVTITAYGRNSLNHIFYDDVKFEEFTPDFPYYEDFTKPESLNAFEIYARGGGIEGVAEAAYKKVGYGAPGALAVVYKSGKCGYGATLKSPLPAGKFGKSGDALTLSVRVSAEAAGGIASIGTEQFDENGKLVAVKAVEVKNLSPKEFQCVELGFTLAPDAVSVRPVLSSNAQVTLFFDDLVIRKATAGEVEVLSREHSAPIWCTVYPADFYAWIDTKPAMLTLPSGEVNAFYVQLAGDKSIPGDTVVEVEFPEAVTLLSGEGGTWSKEPSPWSEITASQKGYRRYRFVNPLDWQSMMVAGKPNPWSGLLLAVKTDAPAGNLGTFSVSLALGDAGGETRSMPIQVFPKWEPVPELKDFFIGIWDLGAIYLHDESARHALIQGYRAAGVVGGAFNMNRPKLAAELPGLGFVPMVIVHGPDQANVYQGLVKKPISPIIRPDGSKGNGHIAFGLALNDPELREAYRKYLAKMVSVLPEEGPKYVNIDIEVWSDGECTKSCFHPSTVEEFRKFAKLGADETLDSKVILSKYRKEWSDFRNDLTARLHAIVRDELHAIDPEIKLLAYDYTLQLDGSAQSFVFDAPMNTLLYDKAVDVHEISYYNYEGVQYLDHIDCDVRTLSKPVFAVPYISEALATAQLPNWNYHHPSTAELTREVLGAAASGAKGFLPFTGKLVDAERLSAIHEGALAVAKYQDYYSRGKRVDGTITIEGMGDLQRYRCHELNQKHLLTVFNCDRKEVKLSGPTGTILVPADGHVQIEY